MEILQFNIEVAVLRSSSQFEKLLLPPPTPLHPPSLSILQVFTWSSSLGLLEGVEAG